MKKLRLKCSHLPRSLSYYPEDLSIEESSGKCLDSHRWDEVPLEVTGKIKGRARILTGLSKNNTFAAKF